MPSRENNHNRNCAKDITRKHMKHMIASRSSESQTRNWFLERRMVKPHLFPNCFLSPHGAAMVYVLLDAFRKLSHAPSVHLNFSEQSIQTSPNDTLSVAISTSKWPYWNILKASSESDMYPETHSDLALFWQESTIWTVLYILECIGTIVWTCKIHLPSHRLFSKKVNIAAKLACSKRSHFSYVYNVHLHYLQDRFSARWSLWNSTLNHLRLNMTKSVFWGATLHPNLY